MMAFLRTVGWTTYGTVTYRTSQDPTWPIGHLAPNGHRRGITLRSGGATGRRRYRPVMRNLNRLSGTQGEGMGDQFANNDGVRIAFELRGEATSTQPIVLVHGLGYARWG